MRPAAGAIAAILATLLLAPAALALPAAPTVTEASLSEVTETFATFSATLNPHEKETTYAIQLITQAAWEADGEAFGAGTQTAAEGKIATALDEPHALSAGFAGLAPATAYRARLYAKSSKGEAAAALPFYTYATPPGGLPDGRAYQQASPPGKDGGDASGTQAFVKAAAEGDGAIFGSTSGIPGGVGSQELPFYLALRSPGAWLSEGLLPPATLAQKANVIGWTPDFSRFYQRATLLGEPQTTALYERAPGGGETLLAPYLPGASYAYAGSSADDQTAVFESSAANLDPAATGAEESPNVYAAGGSGFHLASVLPNGSPAPKGAFAGPYDWAAGSTIAGGAAGQYYTQEERAVSEDGSLFFTTANEGHIYQRRNPTAPEEGCADPAKACTLDVSASHRAPPDPAGHTAAAFLAASADGDTAFFTSPEELTNDAHTGPEVPGPVIGRATIGSAPEEEAEEALPELLAGHHAVGIATRGEFIYWADPTKGTIGRAKLDGSEANDEYVVPGETCAITHPETEPGIEHCAPSTPRYVATGPCAEGGQCIYWTNTGPLGGDLNKIQREVQVGGAGTIGRARLDGSEALVPASVDPDFIAGASNPQGIAVNESHVYWANSLQIVGATEVDIARAALDGSEVEQDLHELGNIFTPYGVALSATRVYWTMETDSGFGTVNSIPLGGLEGSEASVTTHEGVPGDKPRGIAVIGPRLYWAAQGTEEIGRVNLALEKASRESEFLAVKGSLGGLAAEGSHLYWSANGETPPHPGNDLYRFQAQGSGGCAQPGGCLTDLTAEASEENGAEVKGLLGASADGSRLYFVANAVLADNTVENGAGPEEAEPGDCGGFKGSGKGPCNLYAWEAGGGPAGTVSFLARLALHGESDSDNTDWAPKVAVFANGGGRKTSQVSPDGQSLLFRSRSRLTAYQNEGTPEYYLYRQGRGIACVSCEPTLAPPGGTPGLGRVAPVALRAASPAALSSRNLSASGERVLFETADPLSPADANGATGCPDLSGGPNGGSLQKDYFTCLDVYEWEAPGEGSCAEGGPGYSPANQGCLFLISTGRGAGYPALLADASASGEDVFFFDRESLVGQDTDQLADLYDASTQGPIASQNPPPQPPPCEGEACKPEATAPPGSPSPATPSFQGPGNLAGPKPCPKGKVRRHGRCVKRHRHDRRKRGRHHMRRR